MHKLDEPYWDDADFIYWDRAMLQSKGFTVESIDTLSKKGLPEWAAPHINFDHYKPSSQSLRIGDDRSDSPIYINFDTMNVLLGSHGLFINSQPTALRKTLKLYAAMVDKALSINEDSFINNAISNDLIHSFKIKLQTLDKKAVDKNSFWAKEIERLLNH